jgi:hypothetical protein
MRQTCLLFDLCCLRRLSGLWSQNKNSNFYIYSLHIGLQLTKILMVPPKWKIFIVVSNQYFFWCCIKIIGLFSIALCQAISHNLLCFMFSRYNFYAYYLLCSFLLLQVKQSILLYFLLSSSKVKKSYSETNLTEV